MTIPHLSVLVASYGYLAVFALIFIESLGIPAPGEGVLIVTALFAARTHRLNIAGVMATASLAAFLGTCVGYGLGQWAGRPLLARFGGFIGMSPARQRLGQYLFLRHGAKIIFLGRFVAVFRAFAGILAGANWMPWLRFLQFNALGAIAWTSIIGLGAYLFGRTFVHVSRPAGLALAALAVCALVAAVLWARKKEGALQREADAALISPVV